MRILFLNYMNASLATMVRSFELARATSTRGHQVTLAFMHPRFRPPASFRALLERSATASFAIRCAPAAAAAPAAPGAAAGERNPAGADAAGKVTEARPSALGLARQAAASLRYLPAERALVRELRPEVIVARPDQVLSFVVTARTTSTPLVLDTDGPVEELDHYWGIRSGWFRGLDLARARRAGAILYISQVCGDLWRSKKLPEDRLFLCPNGADPDVFRPLPAAERDQARRSLGLEGRKVIAFSGNQRTWHGVGDLLRAAVPLLRGDADLRVLVIGQIEDPAALRLADLPPGLVEERVVFTGPVPYGGMPAALDVADIVALPYPPLDLFHFSPMKMFEALAMGKVLAAPRQGQIGDILGTLAAACLYDPRRPGALETALRTALQIPAARGLEGRGLLQREHTWERRGGVVEAACLRACGGGRVT
jgi:glycosyltransferase involved in cell wall biosynthesis